MKHLKITIAALAFVLTAGLTYANSVQSSAPNDCLTPEGQLINSDDCTGTQRLCCNLVSDNTPIFQD